MNYSTTLEIFTTILNQCDPKDTLRKEMELGQLEFSNLEALVSLPWPPEICSPTDLAAMREVVKTWATAPLAGRLSTALVMAKLCVHLSG